MKINRRTEREQTYGCQGETGRVEFGMSRRNYFRMGQTTRPHCRAHGAILRPTVSHSGKEHEKRVCVYVYIYKHITKSLCCTYFHKINFLKNKKEQGNSEDYHSPEGPEETERLSVTGPGTEEDARETRGKLDEAGPQSTRISIRFMNCNKCSSHI